MPFSDFDVVCDYRRSYFSIKEMILRLSSCGFSILSLWMYHFGGWICLVVLEWNQTNVNCSCVLLNNNRLFSFEICIRNFESFLSTVFGWYCKGPSSVQCCLFEAARSSLPPVYQLDVRSNKGILRKPTAFVRCIKGPWISQTRNKSNCMSDI